MGDCPFCGTQNLKEHSFCYKCGGNMSGNTGGATGRLDPETILDNRYIIVKTLGRGGMGAVYLAFDQRLKNRKVAIKEMSTNAVGQGNLAAAIAAFESEATMLTSLKHQALPTIHDFFSRGEDRWYLVMEFIEGKTLKQVIQERGAIPEAEVLPWTRQLCDILNYLHTRTPPVIFRDLKPANIMLTPEGTIKLIDFGIARHFRHGITEDTAAYGSTGFAPPEQYGQNQTDARSDIYALGATLHYLLTAVDPDNNPFIFDPPSTKSQVSPEFEELVMKAIDLRPDRRYQNVQEMLSHLSGSSAWSNQGAGLYQVKKPVVAEPADEGTKASTPPTTPLVSESLEKKLDTLSMPAEQPDFATIPLSEIPVEEKGHKTGVVKIGKRGIDKRNLIKYGVAVLSVILLFAWYFSQDPGPEEFASAEKLNISEPVAGSSLAKGNVEISWNALPKASKYFLTVTDTESGSEVTKIETDQTSITLADSQLTPGHQYEVALSAVRQDGTKIDTSSDFSVREMSAPVIKSPSNGSIVSKENISVKWDEVPDSSGYVVAAKDLSNNSSIVGSTPVTETGFIIEANKLVPGHQYVVWVSATDRVGNKSGSQTMFTVKNPGTLQITRPFNGSIIEKKDLTISWSGLTGNFKYYFSLKNLTNNTFVVSETVTDKNSYFVNASRLVPGNKYKATVYVKDSNLAAGVSSNSVMFSIKEAEIPISPPQISSPRNGSVVNYGNVSVYWNRVQGAYQYKYDVLNESTNKVVIRSTRTQYASFTLPKAKLTPGHKYKITVAARSKSGKSSASYVRIKIKSQGGVTGGGTGILSAPVIRSFPNNARLFEGVVVIRWNPVSGATGYKYGVSDEGNQSVVNVVSTQKTNFSLGPSVLKAGKAYKIWVAAENRSYQKGTTVNIRIFDTPSISFPLDGASVAKKDITVAWSGIDNGRTTCSVKDVSNNKTVPVTKLGGNKFKISQNYLISGHRYKIWANQKDDSGKNYSDTVTVSVQ